VKSTEKRLLAPCVFIVLVVREALNLKMAEKSRFVKSTVLMLPVSSNLICIDAKVLQALSCYYCSLSLASVLG
jgi:hypothetical protein